VERSSIVGVVMSTVHVNLHYMLKQMKNHICVV